MESCLKITTIPGRYSVVYAVHSVKCAYNPETKTARIYMETDRMPESAMERYLESCGAKSIVIDSLAVEDWEAASLAALKSVTECSKTSGMISMEFGREPKAGLNLEPSAGDEKYEHEAKKRWQPDDRCEGGSSKVSKMNDYGCGSQQELELILARSMVDANKQASTVSCEKNKLEMQLVRSECEWKMEKVEYDRKVKRLSKKVSVLQIENEQLRTLHGDGVKHAELSSRDSEELGRVKGEKADLCVQLDSASGEVTRLKSTNAELCVQLDGKNGELEALQFANMELRKHVDSLNGEVARLTTLSTDLGLKLDCVNGELSVVKSVNVDFQSEVGLLKSETTGLREEIQVVFVMHIVDNSLLTFDGCRNSTKNGCS